MRRALATRTPEVLVLPVPPQTTIPQMRALGFQHASGAAVAVIEDHILVPPDWARQILGGLASGAAVVGGSVYNAATRHGGLGRVPVRVQPPAVTQGRP